MIEKARDVIDGKLQNVRIEMDVENIDRAFASTLSYEVSRYLRQPTYISIFINFCELLQTSLYHLKIRTTKKSYFFIVESTNPNL